MCVRGVSVGIWKEMLCVCERCWWGYVGGVILGE